MKIRTKYKFKNFFKASGITIVVGLAIGIAALAPITLINNNTNKIALIVSTRNNPFFGDIIDAAQKEVNKHKDYSLQVFDSNDDDALQVKNIDFALALGVKAVIINVVNSETAANAGVSKIVSNNIPLIAVDRGIDNIDVDLTIASDNIMGAQELAQSFQDHILNANTPNISLRPNSIFQLRGVSGSQASNDRNTGFKNVFPDTHSEIANFSRPEGFTMTSNYLATDDKKTKLIFAENDEMGLGAIEAIKNRGGSQPYTGTWTDHQDGNIYVLGFDGTEDALASINKDEMYATVIQQPKEMGRIAIDETIKYFINGSFNQDFMASPTIVVDKRNVADYL